MNARPYRCAAEAAGNKPCIYEVQWCQWHLHNLFMRAMMESQLSSAPILQVTKKELWGEGGENDNEDEKREGKQQRTVTETEWMKKDEETGVAEGLTRDVLNSGRQTRKGNKLKDERNWWETEKKKEAEERRQEREQLLGEWGEYFNKPVHVDFARHIRYLCPALCIPMIQTRHNWN